MSLTTLPKREQILIACVSLNTFPRNPLGHLTGIALVQETGQVVAVDTFKSEVECEFGMATEQKCAVYAARCPLGYDLVFLGLAYREDARWLAALHQNAHLYPLPVIDLFRGGRRV